MANNDIFSQYEVPEEPAIKPVAQPVDIFAQYEVKPEPATQPTTDPFAAYEVKPPADDLYTKLQKEKEDYGFLNSLSPTAMAQRGGILTSRGVSDEEVGAYAKHYGLDFDTARKLATLRGAVPPMTEIDSVGELAQTVAGKLNIATGNIAGFLGKKALADDANVRAFLDDIGELADGRSGLAETAIGMFIPGGIVFKAGKSATLAGKAAKAAAAGAGTGAVYGLAGSKENQELESAAQSALFGAGLGGAAPVAVKLLKREGKMPNIDPESRAKLDASVEDYKSTTGLDLSEETAKAYTPVKESHDAMRNSFIDNVDLDEKAVKEILEQQVSPDTKAVIKNDLQERYLSSLPPEEQIFGRQAARDKVPFKELEAAISDEAIAKEITRIRKNDFVDEMASRYPELKYVQGDGPKMKATRDEILATLKRQGDVNLKREYDEWTAGQLAREKLAEATIHIDPNTDVLGKYIINFATDRMFGFKTIAEKYGSDILKDFYQVNTNYNLYTAFKQDALKQVANIYKTAKKYKLNKQEAMDDIYEKLDTGRYAELTPQQKEVADSMKVFYDKQREFFNKASGDGYSPMNIPYRADFTAPQMVVKPVEYVIRMQKKLAQVEAALPNVKNMTTEQFMRETNIRPELAELKQGLELITDLPITNGKELTLAFRDATSQSGGNPRLYRLASTTLPRKGAIPDFLREKNLFKLMSSYVEGTGRNFYLREPLSRIAQKAKTIAEIPGAEQEAKYLERFVQDNYGIRQWSMARIGNQARISFAKNMDAVLQKVISDPERREGIVAGLRFLPELAANLQYNIYPNVLALNPRAHLAQLTQVLFKTSPEVGGLYGYQLATKAMTKAMLNLATPAGRKEFFGRVKTLGLEPSGFVREGREGLREGLEAAIGDSVPAKVLQATADAFMWSYGKMDTLNRAVTAEMAEQIVTDLRAGKASALRAVKKMPSSVRKDLMANKDNVLEQMKAVAVHLNAATQFNYNRASMSELGVTLGPLFSTFTKWPLAISGDVLADMRTKGMFKAMPRIAEKYAAVYLLATAVDSIIHSTLTGADAELNPDMKELSDRARKIVGAGGFKSMAPIASLGAFFPERGEKNLFTPPIVETFYGGVISPILDGDTEKLAKGGMKAMETFFPGAFLNRTFMVDVPTIFGDGSKPESFEEGLSFYERL